MPDTQTRIYLELAPELDQLLNDNGLSADEILRQQNIPAEVTYGVLPDDPDTGARTKEPATIVLASAAAALAIGAAISQVLRTLQRQPQLVEFYELVELRDAEGQVLLDRRGNPQFKRVKRHQLLEPRKEDSDVRLDVGLDPTNGLVISFSSAEKQMDTEDKPQPA